MDCILANVTLMFVELFTSSCALSLLMLTMVRLSWSTLPCMCLFWPPLCPLLLRLYFLMVIIVSRLSFISFILYHFFLCLHQIIMVVSYFMSTTLYLGRRWCLQLIVLHMVVNHVRCCDRIYCDAVHTFIVMFVKFGYSTFCFSLGKGNQVLEESASLPLFAVPCIHVGIHQIYHLFTSLKTIRHVHM